MNLKQARVKVWTRALSEVGAMDLDIPEDTSEEDKARIYRAHQEVETRIYEWLRRAKCRAEGRTWGEP